ncbi:NAD(P)H-hydrate dehydratase [Corynebacterium lizhenjunii]|uniref:ADP-dependent (S)-NAD(P)H-hydrate dehydratase n=1 Tax=Corynebacterium lizhenjunii TaxID=2709394 RepID=A0A7T0KEK0_9CORY|nr:NAD(P)H-hydrate dehydratase [Corynebacterium lizhenjunii]QPK79079.1 NAD(P)H-hydrate dehydratase [Corynebacterium lizhenjunii]
MLPAFDVATVRAAEANLLACQARPDELMQLAATAVAEVAQTMLDTPLPSPAAPVLILAGPGGNGGDGLYAGAQLARAGFPVTAVLCAGSAHAPALDALRAAGAVVLESADAPLPTPALIIDAVAGLGSARGLDGVAWQYYRNARESGARGTRVLAVDMPAGVDAHTGHAHSQCVHADVTITFGYPRTGHLHAPECGRVMVADLKLEGASASFAQELERSGRPAGYLCHEASLEEAGAEVGAGLRDAGSTGAIVDPTPGVRSNKYSGGVVGVAAGSQAYPGAGVLAATAAVRATPALVRVISHASPAAAIIAAVPEVVVHPQLDAAGRMDALVIGPGRGTDAQAAAELAAALQIDSGEIALVIDADALTLLSQDSALRELLRQRRGVSVLTPHEGEFARLYRAVCAPRDGAGGKAGSATAGGAGGEAGPESHLESRSRGELAGTLARELHSIVLLKGRITTIADPDGGLWAVNTGNSFAATAGSGDVLAGLLGALLAQGGQAAHQCVLSAIAIHAHAAALAAWTPEGYAGASASRIANALPRATAKLLRSNR